MYRTVLLFILSLTITFSFGQNSVNDVLNSIKVKNKSIVTNTQFLEAKRLQNHTGIMPGDPKAEFDYMLGTPSNLGNQTDIIVVQAFDFPTAYGRKMKLASGQTDKISLETDILRQAVLLDAKLACIEIIHINKHIKLFERRILIAKQVVADMQAMVETGESTVIELSKAKLVLLKNKTDVRKLESERTELLFKLAELNGGEEVLLSDTVFESLILVPDVETVETLIESIDPQMKLFQQQMKVSALEVSLAKAMVLPKIETGYHYQTILGQTFRGVHFGFSIPLWENKNLIKQSEAYSLFTAYDIEQHLTSHQFEIRTLHERYTALKANLEEYEAAIGSLTNAKLLKQSLQLGQISFTVYATELEFYYDAFDTYLELEEDLHKTIAELYKHEL